ncbi:hypothetical protein F4859DRAFT_497926 [Xylaria cf. heliscus]|nr:hypothetical protein F4859DRAFT_497926 [Xylaria cf. heliscus]
MEAHGSSGTSPVSNDPLEMFDFMKYGDTPFQSPSLSPTGAGKAQFTPPTTSMSTTPATMPPSQLLSGPSHQYDAYKQQTPLVPGALANTLAINEANVHMANYGLDYISPGEELYNFNTSPQNPIATPDMDIDFESSTEQAFFFPAAAVNNTHHGNTSPASVATQSTTAGRMYPGMHVQLAAQAQAQAEAQAQNEVRAQNKLKYDMERMRRQDQQHRPQPPKHSRPKVSQPTDPIVEQKITQLLNSMRSNPITSEPDDDDGPLVQVPRLKKEQDDMDEDERLLASEEGKKLSSKERRQLRNKVSARAFRSRRKEYIGQLESEVAAKVTENNDLRRENRGLMDENQRLTNLTRMLLSSAPFSSFLENLSQNPTAILAQVQPQMEQRQPEPNHIPKDANPYNMSSFGQQQQIGMVMLPEQSMDYSIMHNMGSNPSYQPRVFALVETPELPEIDTEALMGKSSNFVEESPTSNNDKTDAPSLEAPIPSTIEKPQVPEVNSEPSPTETKVSNLDGDIFDDDCSTPSPRPLELDTDGFSAVDIFGGIESEKAFARYELVDSSEEEKLASMALRRVERLAASLAATISALERLDVDM